MFITTSCPENTNACFQIVTCLFIKSCYISPTGSTTAITSDITRCLVVSPRGKRGNRLIHLQELPMNSEKCQIPFELNTPAEGVPLLLLLHYLHVITSIAPSTIFLLYHYRYHNTPYATHWNNNIFAYYYIIHFILHTDKTTPKSRRRVLHWVLSFLYFNETRSTIHYNKIQYYNAQQSVHCLI